MKITIIVLAVVVVALLQFLDIHVISIEGVIIIAATVWLTSSIVEQHKSRETADLKSDIVEKLEEHVDDRVNKTVDILEEKFSKMIDPTVERVGELVWMYKKDHPHHEEEDNLL